MWFANARDMRFRLFLRLLLSIPLALGCAPAAAEEETDTAGGEINAREAAGQAGLSKQLLWDHPASDGVAALGVRRWTVWGVREGDAAGSVVFGEDGVGEVRYAIVVSATGKVGAKAPGKKAEAQIAIVGYDKAGPTTAATDAATAKTLLGDFGSIQRALAAGLAADKAEAKSDCLAQVGIVAVGIGALALAAYLAAPVLAFALSDAAVTLLGFSMLAGRTLAASTVAIFATGIAAVTDAYTSCSLALR